MTWQESSNNKSKLLPIIWIFLIAAVSVAILNFGFEMLETRERNNRELAQTDQAKQILTTLAYGSTINPYLPRIAKGLEPVFRAAVSQAAISQANQHRKFLRNSFPEHEFWVFGYRKTGDKLTASPVFTPEITRSGRRGMANAIAALAENDRSNGMNKLIDFLFGPGLKVKMLSQRIGRATRIIYNNRYCLLVWNNIIDKGKKIGGYFFIVPDTAELTKFAMERSARVLSGDKSGVLAGYLNLSSENIGSVIPPEARKNHTIMEFIENWRVPPTLQKLEQNPIPSGVPIGTWKFYTRAIPDGNHLAFAFLKDPENNSTAVSPIRVINVAFGIAGLMILGLLILDKCPFSLSLSTRFSLLFLALAAIPFSLLLVSARLYLSELKVSMLREARQKLHKALSSFDQSVDDVYRVYKNEMRKLHQELWTQQAIEETDPVKERLDVSLKEYISRLSPPLPWGSVIICDAKGKTILTYRNEELQNRLDGYMTINRVGIIEAMRKRRNMPSIAEEGKSDLISDDDITMKQVYETQVKLPIYHAFSNANVGELIQIAFGNMSVMRIVDYFPSEYSPVIGISVVWFEHELDREFSINALKKMKRENPGIHFEVFKKDDNDLIRIARTHKQSNLHNIARSASLRDGFANSQAGRDGRIAIAFPSNRRPGIFLAGAMDTTYINKQIDHYFRRFVTLLILGFLGILYFRDFFTNASFHPSCCWKRHWQACKTAFCQSCRRLPDMMN